MQKFSPSSGLVFAKLFETEHFHSNSVRKGISVLQAANVKFRANFNEKTCCLQAISTPSLR